MDVSSIFYKGSTTFEILTLKNCFQTTDLKIQQAF